MIPKIKINELNNDLYTITNTQCKDVAFYDVSPKGIPAKQPSIEEHLIEVEHIKLNKLRFYVEKNSIWNCNYEIINLIKNKLNKEYINIVSELGKQNSEKYLNFGNNFDEDRIISILDHAISYYYNKSNIWLLSNNQTFNHIFNKIAYVIDNMN